MSALTSTGYQLRATKICQVNVDGSKIFIGKCRSVKKKKNLTVIFFKKKLPRCSVSFSAVPDS